MINQLAENFLRAQQSGAPAAPESLEGRLGLPKASTSADTGDANIDQLYANLKSFWQANPDIESPDIIDYIRGFVAADGSRPYKEIPTHTGALAQLMGMLKREGGEDSPIYAKLNKGLGFAVVSNGIFNSFTMKMLERPEEPEPW